MLERLVAPYANMMEGAHRAGPGRLGAGRQGRGPARSPAALAIKPDSEIAVLTLAQVSADEASAESLLARFLEANPDAREVRAAYARLLVDARKFDAARDELRLLHKAQPDKPHTLYALGILSMQLNDAAGAENYLQALRRRGRKGSPTARSTPAKAYDPAGPAGRGPRRQPGRAGAGSTSIEQTIRGWFGAQLQRAQLTAKGGDVDGARKLLATPARPPTEDASRPRCCWPTARSLRDAGQQRGSLQAAAGGRQALPGQPGLAVRLRADGRKDGPART